MSAAGTLTPAVRPVLHAGAERRRTDSLERRVAARLEARVDEALRRNVTR